MCLSPDEFQLLLTSRPEKETLHYRERDKGSYGILVKWKA